MDFSKKDLIIFTLISVLFYLYFKKRENFTNNNTDIKKVIEENYKIDVESIRNLSNLANQLTKNGRLVVPGGLEIKGRLTVNGPTNLNGGTNIKGDTNFYKPVAFKNQKTGKWSYINHRDGICVINSRVDVYGPTNFYKPVAFKNQKTSEWTYINHTDGNCIINSRLDVVGLITLKGEAYFYNPVGFKNQKKKGKWTYINHKDGNCIINSSMDVYGKSTFHKDVDGKNVISHGDRIKVYNPNAEGYLSKQDLKIMSGMAGYVREADDYSNLIVYKE